MARALTVSCLWLGVGCTTGAMAQTENADLLSGLGLARLKNYSAARTSSGNRYVLSNDDSKRIMPGETFVMADISGAGMITHIWLTVAENEFGWPRLLRFRVYYDGHKTPSVDAPLGDFFPEIPVAPAGCRLLPRVLPSGAPGTQRSRLCIP